MLEILKKKSNKSIIIQCVIAILVFSGCLIYCGIGFIQLCQDPKSIENVEDISEYEGKYVSFEVEYIMSDYLWTTSRNTETNVEETTAMAYIIYNYDMDTCFGFEIKTSDDTIYDDFITDTWNCIYYDEPAPESFVIQGTLKPIKGDALTYFNETANEIFSEEYKEDIYPYYIDCDSMNETTIIRVMIALYIAQFAFIYLICNLAKAKGSGYMKFILQYLAANPNITLASIELDFDSAAQVGNNIWVGKMWTIYLEGTHIRIVNNETIVWAYYYQRTGRRPENKIITYDINKNCVTIDVSSSYSNTILNNWSQHQPHMILGYDKELEKVFNKDFDTFLNYKYNHVKATNYNQEDDQDTSYGNEYYSNEQ